MGSPRLRAILDLVDQLEPSEKDELRAQLEGPPGDAADWTRAWNDELARRIEQIERGEVELVDGEDFVAELLGEARS